MIPANLYFFALLAVGYAEGDRDANISNEHGTIDHPGRWKFRAFMALLLCVPTIPFLHWHTLLLLPIAYGAFNIAFRLTINGRRTPRKDWRYISPSSAYDRLFMRMTMGTWYDFAVEDFRGWYAVAGSTFVRWTHRAGLLAYLIEGVAVLAAFITLYLAR